MKYLHYCTNVWSFRDAKNAVLNDEPFVSYTSSEMLVTYSPPLINPSVTNGHKFVDLGLPSGTLWAQYNIGSSSYYNQSGDHFAWGEVETKSSYTSNNYKFGSTSSLTKYNSTDLKTTLDLEDDAAHVLWGGLWKIPTKAQYDEMKNNCTRTKSGSSYTFTSNINGNSITLYTYGYIYQSSNSNTGDYYLWLSELTSSGSGQAYIACSSNTVGLGRTSGLCIRPVLTLPSRTWYGAPEIDS